MDTKGEVRHCLPGESPGDTSWFERLSVFEKQETRRQVDFKHKYWPELVDGSWSKRLNYHYPHILPEGNIEKSLFSPMAQEVLSYLDHEDIALHSEALNLRSSQVCCLNVLFPLKKNRVLAKVVLAPVLPQVESVEDIEFEYTGPSEATTWLGEPPGGKRGQNRTSIDAAVWWKDKADRRCITLLEWKYTERGFGSCGGYESDSNTEKNRCRILDATGSHPEKECFLTSGKPQTSRHYWEYLSVAGINSAKFADVAGCPFRGPFYQILRQFLLAAYLRRHAGDVDRVYVAVVSFEGNGALLRCPLPLKPLLKDEAGTVLDAWNAVVVDVPPFRAVTVEQLMVAADDALPRGNPWRGYLRERYGI